MGCLAPAPPQLIAASHAFARATLRRRFTSPAALAVLRRLVVAISHSVGRCRLTLSKSVLKGPVVSALEAKI